LAVRFFSAARAAQRNKGPKKGPKAKKGPLLLRARRSAVGALGIFSLLPPLRSAAGPRRTRRPARAKRTEREQRCEAADEADEAGEADRAAHHREWHAAAHALFCAFSASRWNTKNSHECP
jgi:hypothetical protein